MSSDSPDWSFTAPLGLQTNGNLAPGTSDKLPVPAAGCWLVTAQYSGNSQLQFFVSTDAVHNQQFDAFHPGPPLTRANPAGDNGSFLVPVPAAATLIINNPGTTGSVAYQAVFMAGPVPLLLLGQEPMASSAPVVIASDQSDLPVKTGTGGDLGVNLDRVGAALVALGSHLQAQSIPVVIASDQAIIPINLSQYGGTAVGIGQQAKAASISVALATQMFPTAHSGKVIRIGVGTTAVLGAPPANQCYRLFGGMFGVSTANAASALDLVGHSSGIIYAEMRLDSIGQFSWELDGAPVLSAGNGEGLDLTVIGGGTGDVMFAYSLGAI